MQEARIGALLVFLLACSGAGRDSVPPGILCLQEQNFNIFHAAADSSSAQNAAVILKTAYEEITWDFHILAGDTFTVLIVPTRKEFQKFIKDNLPSWTEAAASPSTKRMMVKSPRWAMSGESYAVSLVHELLHLILFRTTSGKPVPRWLDEGLAIFYSKEKRWMTVTSLSRALMTHSVIPLDQIDQVLSFQQIKAELAYQESYSATQYLLATYDIDAVQLILAGIRDNRDRDEIFTKATGSDYHGFEQEWLRYAQKKYKWFWLSDMDDFIWLIIFALFITAIFLIRRRNSKTLQKWEMDSAAQPGGGWEQLPEQDPDQAQDPGTTSE